MGAELVLGGGGSLFLPQLANPTVNNPVGWSIVGGLVTGGVLHFGRTHIPPLDGFLNIVSDTPPGQAVKWIGEQAGQCVFGTSDAPVPQPMTAAEQQAYRQWLANRRGSVSSLPSVGSTYVPTTASPIYSSPMPAAMTAEQLQQQFQAQQLAQTQHTLHEAFGQAAQWANNFRLAGLQARPVAFAPAQAGQYPHTVAQQAYQTAQQQAFAANQAAQQQGNPTRTIAFTHPTDTGLEVPMLVTGTPQQLAQWLNPLRQNADGSYAQPILSATDFRNSGVSANGLEQYVPTASQRAGLPALPTGVQPSEFMDVATRPNDVAFMLEQNVAHNQRNASRPNLLLQLPSGKAFSVDGLSQAQLIAYLQQVLGSGLISETQLDTNLEQNGLNSLMPMITREPDSNLGANAANQRPQATPQVPTHTGHTPTEVLPPLEGFDTTAPTVSTHTGHTDRDEDFSLSYMAIFGRQPSQDVIEDAKAFREQYGLDDTQSPEHDALHQYLGLGPDQLSEIYILGIEARANGEESTGHEYRNRTWREAYAKGYNLPQGKIDELKRLGLICQ
jgi:hypothetical protein